MVERYVIAVENILKKMEKSVAPRKKRISAIRNILHKIEMDYKELEKVFERTHDELGERLNMIVRQQVDAVSGGSLIKVNGDND